MNVAPPTDTMAPPPGPLGSKLGGLGTVQREVPSSGSTLLALGWMRSSSSSVLAGGAVAWASAIQACSERGCVCGEGGGGKGVGGGGGERCLESGSGP